MKKLCSLLLCAVMLMTGIYCVSAKDARDYTVEEGIASNLKNLGIFKGVSDTDFALDRAPTRVEALIMLIRVLGK